MSVRKLTIGITGLNAIDNPGPGVAVIRAIRECKDFDVRIIGLSYEALEPGLYMRDIVDKSYQVPYPSAGIDALHYRLKYIHSQEQLNLIIPNFDAELFNYIKLAPILEDMGIKTFLPSLEQFEARHKIELFNFGKKHGLDVPEDRSIFSELELKEAAEVLDYPLVVKGKFYDAVITNTFEQSQKAFYQLQAKWGLPIIAQKFIKGTEINIAVLGDGKGRMISAIPMRKLYITDKGKAWAGITLNDNIYIDLAKKFIQATSWKGGCELEVMQTTEGKLYIMEVNPRFPAWIYLTAAAGQNQPASLVKMAMDEEVKPFDSYDAGKIFIRYAWDMVVNVEEFQKISGTGEL